MDRVFPPFSPRESPAMRLGKRERERVYALLATERGTRNAQEALAAFSRVATKAGIPFHRHVSDLYLARPSRANNMCSLLSIHGSFAAPETTMETS